MLLQRLYQWLIARQRATTARPALPTLRGTATCRCWSARGVTPLTSKVATLKDPFGYTVGLRERTEQDEADKRRAARMLLRAAAGVGLLILAVTL